MERTSCGYWGRWKKCDSKAWRNVEGSGEGSCDEKKVVRKEK